jgi:hypothetical protein
MQETARNLSGDLSIAPDNASDSCLCMTPARFSVPAFGAFRLYQNGPAFAKGGDRFGVYADCLLSSFQRQVEKEILHDVFVIER